MHHFDSFMLLRGIVIGFLIAAPVGPAGFLCIERTLNRGRIAGLISGFGASAADLFYGAIAAFGVAHLSHAIITHGSILRFAGAVLMIGIGFVYLYKKPKEPSEQSDTPLEFAKDFFSSFSLTITNPLTVVSFATLFASASFGNLHDWWSSLVLTLGVFIGAMMCWSLLVFAVAWIHKKAGTISMRIVSRSAGVVFLLFGIVMLMSGLGGNI